ncbi:MAG: hypothetical protein WBW71_08905 [Bacteroidota bacterium]
MKLCGFSFGFAAMICAVVAIATLSSCKDTVTSPISGIVFPAKNISYQKLVQPLFNIGCAIAGCHDSQNTTLNLTSYGLWLQDPLVIIAGDSTNSRLVWCIEAKPGSSPMPPARPLSQNQIQGLKQWIYEGAKNTQ